MASRHQYQDLREWLQVVDGIGELARLDGVHWKLEIGALTDAAVKRKGPIPALLFDNIVGYDSGYRVLSSMLNSVPRLGLTCGLPMNLSEMEFLRAWQERSREIQPLAPRIVERGPILENVFEGDAIDLSRFPTPLWHEEDGGRYIGTACSVITRDPDDGRLNMAPYRVMIQGERRLSVYIAPEHHGRLHRNKFFERGEPCPVAITFGQDPLLLIAGVVHLNYGEFELAWAGGVRNAPIEVIEGKVTGLPIPAAAEIAIEGFIVKDDLVSEGPFGEYTGYYAGGQTPHPVIQVHRLMHRNDPILCGAPRGRPPDDPSFWQRRFTAGRIWQAMEGAGVPGIQGVWCHLPNAPFFTVVSIKARYPGHSRQAGLVAQQCYPGIGGRWVVVVDEDIDPANIDDVLWALATRADPERAIEITRYCLSYPLDTVKPPEERIFGSRTFVDACKPWEWRDRFPKTAETSPELMSRVVKQFGHLIWREGEGQ